MNKYLVWKSSIEGEYVLADGVEESHDTVSFLRGKIVWKSFLKVSIIRYSKVSSS